MSHIKISTLSTDNCTIGILKVGTFACFTLELPWLNNQPNVSCIPPNKYHYVMRESPSLGTVIHILDVQGRTWIYIHKGNFTSQIQGCILVGTLIKDINQDGTPDVGNSADAWDALMEVIEPTGEVTICRSIQ
jgi:hypothetical protein